MKDKKIIKTYTVSFGFNSKGDGTTTLEGRFYLQKHFGDKTLLLAYPSRHNARLGLEKKLISKDQYYKIIRAINEGETPPQNTKLGGSVRIHDGGTHKNCALACFKMNDKDISELYKLMPKGLIIVEVYNSQAQDEKINKSNYTSTMILDNLPKVLGQKAKYTKKAMSYIPLTYPNGDFDPKHAVCTDVIIRVLRGAKLDLQALLHEDIIVNPTRYKSVKKANYHIDHRRTRVLKYYFDHNSKVLSNNVLSNDWLPGDIVLFDTGVRNGTIFDHIGIVAQKKSALGRHLVFNIWTEGDETSVMDLLTGVYPTVVGHYRMLNPLFYL
ncbi:DUF1287 domain-containing protein [Candidatus Microgenomates bacterium]|nr:DUF1287 domain-containing protein [Candidatus Microgenomates bacterium]